MSPDVSTLPTTPDAPDADALRQSVRAKYAAVARGEALSCCGPSGCGDGDAVDVNMIGDAYDGVEGYVEAADLGLGCGLPVEHAGLAPGQTVLDLGAGAGLDAFVARRVVGESGAVLGVDFTPEMVAKARENAAALGYENVRFEHGDVEALPFADASVDVVVSNCVLNLVPDKPRAFAEAFRVLRPGGHVCVSDVVSRGALPASVRASAELYAGCVAGALDREVYLGIVRAAGFEGVEVVAERPIDLPAGLLPSGLLPDGLAHEGAEAPLLSVTVRATRPAHSGEGATLATAASGPETDAEMETATLRVYDPPQCCSTGVCGPDVDPALVQFAADLQALAAEGVAVERFNLAQQPEAFVAEPAVVQAVNAVGTSVLPLLVVAGRVVSHGRYPPFAEIRSLVREADDAPAFRLEVSASTCCGPDAGCC
jgi:SAM-dependent methyltransferase